MDARGAQTGEAAVRTVDRVAACAQDPYVHARRPTCAVFSDEVAIGGDHPVRVELELGVPGADVAAQADRVATALAMQKEIVCEGFVLDVHDAADHARARVLAAALATRGQRVPVMHRVPWSQPMLADGAARMLLAADPATTPATLEAAAKHAVSRRLAFEVTLDAQPPELAELIDVVLAAADASGASLLLSIEAHPGDDRARFVHAVRLVAAQLRARDRDAVPIVLRGARGQVPDGDARLLAVASDLGAPLCDGIGDAVSLPADAFGDAGRTLDTTYRILQGARLRTTRTEFISCPSCGRTLFDLEETTARIKARTAHLSGLKIAIMGCIVNGPGEMADADFGYVGSGPGTVSLYVGKQLVERHVPAAEADDRLVALIRAHGAWREVGS
jgi:(E)-4-hydroxy-3-methylbut-2-enyl-diphosphate synthase